MCSRCFKCFLQLFVLCLVVGACAPPPPAPPTPQKSSEVQQVAVPGGSIAYRVHGDGAPVVLIHGSGFADVFETLLTQPVLADYQLITYHRRGYGASTRAAKPFTLEQQAADALALLDELDIERAHLVGHSYGGSVALEMARRYPRRVASLVLLEAAVPSLRELDPQIMQGAMKAGELFAKGDAAAAIETFSDAVVPGSWAMLPPAMKEQAIADAGTFFEVEMPAIMEWRFGAAEAATVRIPALLVLGGNSHPGVRAAHSALLRALPTAEEQVIENVGHELQMAHPQPVATVINTFLRQHPIQ